MAESALERSGSRAGPDYVGPTGSQVRREADCHTPSESAQDRCASRVCSDCVSDHALRAAIDADADQDESCSLCGSSRAASHTPAGLATLT